MTVSLPPELKAAIEAAAKADDRSVSSWCVRHLREHLPEEPVEKPKSSGGGGVETERSQRKR